MTAKSESIAEPVITIPIGDWLDEYMAAEPDMSTEDAMLRTQIERKLGPLAIGRHYLVARERGETDPDILPANKPLVNAGAAAAWSTRIAQRKRMLDMPNGKQYAAREIIAPVPEQKQEVDGLFEEAEPPAEPPDYGLVFLDEPERAISRATDYLLERVPGYIWGRLVIIAGLHGDVQSVAEALHDKIDEMMGRLTG